MSELCDRRRKNACERTTLGRRQLRLSKNLGATMSETCSARRPEEAINDPIRWSLEFLKLKDEPSESELEAVASAAPSECAGRSRQAEAISVPPLSPSDHVRWSR